METVQVPPFHGAGCIAALDAVEDAMYVIGGKWKLRIIISLADGKKRFNELQRVLKGISARVLSSELKDLELNGFVKRLVDPSTATLSVEYERTEYADTLHQIVRSLREWGVEHKKKITQR